MKTIVISPVLADRIDRLMGEDRIISHTIGLVEPCAVYSSFFDFNHILVKFLLKKGMIDSDLRADFSNYSLFFTVRRVKKNNCDVIKIESIAL